MSQAQLAHPELSDSYVSLIESGKRTPTPAVLDLLAHKLDCSLTYLVNGVTAEQMEELEMGLRFARLALENGELAEARRRYQELLADSNLAGLASLRQEVRYGYALATEACGDFPEAIGTLEALRTDTEGQSTERAVQIAVALCRCYQELGDFGAAVQIGEEVLGLTTSRPEWNDELVELGATLLFAYLDRGDLLRSRQFSAELLAAAESLGTPRSIVAACWNSARTAEEVGSGEEAMALIERALAVQSENGQPRNLARLRSGYAMLLLRVRPAEASTARDASLRALRELRESSAGKVPVARCQVNLACAEMALGNPHAALDYALAARETVAGGTSNAVLAEIHLVLGQAYWMLHRDEEAVAELHAAAECFERLLPTRAVAQNWQAAAETLGRLGEHESSIAAYHRALACAGL